MADNHDPAEAIRARIAAVEGEIARLTEESERLHLALSALNGREQCDNTEGMGMPTFEKLKRSQNHPANSRTAKLRAACNAKNLSIRDLATLAQKRTRYKRISQAHLSMAAAGDRPIDAELAEWIAGQVDYPATIVNWPKLRTE